MSPRAPSVEFVVPYHGSPEYLEIAVRSVIAQSDPDWTMIVVQDGPQASPLTPWLAGLADGRIRFEVNESNLGVAGNFQRCLDLATGAYVVFLGCDDELLPAYVARVRQTIVAHPGIAVVQPGVDIIDADGRLVQPMADRVKRLLTPRPSSSSVQYGESLMTSLLHGNWLYFPSLCWRRDAIAHFGFRQDLPVTLDLALVSQVILDGTKLTTFPDTVFRYRRHVQSASSVAARALDRFDEERRVFAEIEDECRSKGWTRAARAARWHVSSRLHAASLLTHPSSWSGRGTSRLVRHLVCP